MKSLEDYFQPYRENTVGIDTTFASPYGEKKIIYADWLASGRLYMPIEQKLLNTFGPFVANTHSETSETGTRMTQSYHYAHKLIKQHLNAGPNDVIITAGTGMTTVINKLQRILSLKGCGKMHVKNCLNKIDHPVVFITHMEHHSNHTSWHETVADVVLLKPGRNLLVEPAELEKQLKKYMDRKFKIGAFTACSNVTGVKTPYHELASLMHQHGGICFVDFAASAPYVDINMHPEDPLQKLDAIFFSPHKFLGGPGSSGVLVFDKSLYHNEVPDNPGGGTVDWTNPWGKYKYVDDIEVREDGGTPGFLQAIKAALAIQLKEHMGVPQILEREKQLVHLALEGLRKINGIYILANNINDRLGVISFYHERIHFNLMVRLLNDLFGIQVRGGCACAGTYGHYLLEVTYEKSKEITDLISSGDLSRKPGWVRWSIHPTTTNEEVFFFLEAVKNIISRIQVLENDYIYVNNKNEFIHKKKVSEENGEILDWFRLDTGNKPKLTTN
ncbi:MAG: aminotransferase class V-fold PLP-dependent enzyme [Bacteroidota bacterium]